MPADALQQFALAALLALLPRGNAGLVRLHLALGLFQVLLEPCHRTPSPTPSSGSLPSSISSSSSSMRAVKPTSKISSKLFTSRSLTFSPSIVGVKRPWSLVTYSRSTIVEMIDAYVDGRPMPFSSSSFTSVASVVARRRLGKMLLGPQRFQAQDLALASPRGNRRPSLGFRVLVVLAFSRNLVDGQVAVELLHRPGGAERVIARRDVDASSGRTPPAPSAKPRTAARSAGTAEQIVAQKRPHVRRRARTHRSAGSLRALPARPSWTCRNSASPADSSAPNSVPISSRTCSSASLETRTESVRM